MGNTKILRINLRQISIFLFFFFILLPTLQVFADSREKAQERLNKAQSEIETYKKEQNGNIPKFEEMWVTCLKITDSTPSRVCFESYKDYIKNIMEVNWISQLFLIEEKNPKLATEIIGKYRTLFDLAQSLDLECNECETRIRDRDCRSACGTLVVVLAKSSASLAINAAEFCARHKMKSKAKTIYREIIVNYPGFAYKSYVKQAEFGLEDLK